ncbi:MAG: TlpA family protein disulfide reductase [Acidimicrobiia bacterium]
MFRLTHAIAALTFVVAACGSGVDAGAIPELPPATPADMEAILAAADRPVVLNVWASWCIPCRSEAPLLDRAAGEFGEEVRFIGINVRDGQTGAREFIAEFFPDAAIEHYLDRPGVVPGALGGNNGVPITFFFGEGGDLVEVHFGIIDERTLALQIDELRARHTG